MQKHRLTSFILAAIMVFGAMAYTGEVRAKEEDAPMTLDEAMEATAENVEEGGMSEEFEAYIKHPRYANRSSRDRATGLVPSIKELHTNYDEINKYGAMRANLPRYYDLRKTGRLTPIRDQGPNGSCWAFACYGALESYLRPQRYFDFSEKHQRNTHGFDFKPDEGGNREMSTAYMARWSGPVAEADDPYDPYDFYSKKDLPRQQDLLHAYFLPARRNKTDNDIIKRTIMELGAVSTIINGNNSYLNRRNAAFYDYSNSGANHAVVIVGWDDDYSRRNFLSTPPGDGAFIVRNSWGANWGDKGYYYVSYYDNNIGTQNTVYVTENKGKRTGVYQYDPLGYTDDMGFRKNDAWMANIFGPVQRDETIVSIGFYAPSNGAEYEIYINDDVNSSNPFGRKTKVATGRLTYAGYHVVDIEGVRVKRGNSFAPIIHINTPGYNRPIAVERPYRGFSSGARAYKGQSFISSDGVRYSDVTNSIDNTNVCIKAYTGKAGSTPSPNPTPDPEPAQELNVSVKPEKAFYEPGETMSIDIQVKDKHNKGVDDAALAIEVVTPTGRKYNFDNKTDSLGKCDFRLRLTTSAVKGKYTFNVTASKDGYSEGLGTGTITCREKVGNMHLNLESSRTSYRPGDTASFVAKVTNDEGRTLQHVKVKFALKINGKTEVVEKLTDRYGKAYYSYYISYSNPSETANLAAEAFADNWNADSANLSFTVVGKEPAPNPTPDPEPENAISVTVTPSKSSYKLGDSAIISIYSMYEGKYLPNASVAGKVVMPNGKEISFTRTTNYNGRVAIKLNTKTNGMAGTYVIKAVISKTGYETGEGQASIKYYR